MITKTLNIHYRLEARYKRSDDRPIGWCIHDTNVIPDLEGARKHLAQLRRDWGDKLEFRVVRIHESVVVNA